MVSCLDGLGQGKGKISQSSSVHFAMQCRGFVARKGTAVDLHTRPSKSRVFHPGDIVD